VHQVVFRCFRNTEEDTIFISRVFMWIYVIPLHEFVRWSCVFSKGRALKPLLRFVSIVKEGETTRPWRCRAWWSLGSECNLVNARCQYRSHPVPPVSQAVTFSTSIQDLIQDTDYPNLGNIIWATDRILAHSIKIDEYTAISEILHQLCPAFFRLYYHCLTLKTWLPTVCHCKV